MISTGSVKSGKLLAQPRVGPHQRRHSDRRPGACEINAALLRTCTALGRRQAPDFADLHRSRARSTLRTCNPAAEIPARRRPSCDMNRD